MPTWIYVDFEFGGRPVLYHHYIQLKNGILALPGDVEAADPTPTPDPTPAPTGEETPASP